AQDSTTDEHPRHTMNIPRASEQSKTFFRASLPQDPRITVRPMFGNESAFVNGNMFYGLFGNELFIRLPDEDRTELLEIKGSSLLEPMKGRPMKEYVVLPRAWLNQPETLQKWISRSLRWASQLPEKKSKEVAKSQSGKKWRVQPEN